MKPLCIDLCCGLGGWARGFLDAGYDVIGFDIEALPYPGQMVVQDIRTLNGRRFRGATVIVASPPCQEFSRHSMPWTRKLNPPPPDMSLVEACYRIAREAEVPLVLENVKGAAPFLGKPVARYGSRYLWGDGVPAELPKAPPSRKERLSSKQFRERAIIPYELSLYLANHYLEERERLMPYYLLGKGGGSVGCAPRPVEKGEDPLVTLQAAHGGLTITIDLSPGAAHALGTALIEDAKAGRDAELLTAAKGEG